MNDKITIIELYELQGKNDIRFSPPCWTIKLCMRKKGLQFKTIPIGFSEKDNSLLGVLYRSFIRNDG